MTVVAETFVPRSSSRIAEIRYDPDVENMEVDFVSDGSTYTYFNVPAATYRNFCAAGSQGQFFERYIKGRFSYERTG